MDGDAGGQRRRRSHCNAVAAAWPGSPVHSAGTRRGPGLALDCAFDACCRGFRLWPWWPGRGLHHMHTLFAETSCNVLNVSSRATFFAGPRGLHGGSHSKLPSICDFGRRPQPLDLPRCVNCSESCGKFGTRDSRMTGSSCLAPLLIGRPSTSAGSPQWAAVGAELSIQAILRISNFAELDGRVGKPTVGFVGSLPGGLCSADALPCRPGVFGSAASTSPARRSNGHIHAHTREVFKLSHVCMHDSAPRAREWTAALLLAG